MTRVNIILLGERDVGKTSVVKRFKTGEYKDKGNQCTIGPVDFLTKKVNIKGKEVSVFLWDTSGEERYNALVKSYYRKGEGVLLLYDVTRPPTFYNLSKWLCELKQVNEISEILIAGNKNDDSTKKTVNISMVKNFARDEQLEYMEISAKTGENIDKAFEYVITKVLIRKGILSPDGAAENKVPPDETTGKEIILLKKSSYDSDKKIPSCAKKKSGSCC